MKLLNSPKGIKPNIQSKITKLFQRSVDFFLLNFPVDQRIKSD